MLQLTTPCPISLTNPHPHLVSLLHPRNSFVHCPKPPSPRQTVMWHFMPPPNMSIAPSLHALIAPIPYCIAETTGLRFGSIERRIYNCYSCLHIYFLPIYLFISSQLGA